MICVLSSAASAMISLFGCGVVCRGPRGRGVEQARGTCRLPGVDVKATSRVRDPRNGTVAGSGRRCGALCRYSAVRLAPASISATVRRGSAPRPGRSARPASPGPRSAAVSRRCATKSRLTRSPYRSPSKSSTYASTRCSRPANVGFVPIDTAARTSCPARAARPRRRRRPGSRRTACTSGSRSGSPAPGRVGRPGRRRPRSGAAGRARPRPPRRRRRPRRSGCTSRRTPCRLSITSARILDREAERTSESGQQLDVAGRPVAEPEVVADHDRATRAGARPGRRARTPPAGAARTAG